MKILRLLVALSLVFSIQAWAAEPPTTSDFIDELPALQPYPDMAGAWLWNKPGVQLKDYDKILLTDIEIFLAPDSKYKGINADQMKVLSDSMRAVMTQALEPDFPVVSEPGPGVMEIHIALTNVYLQKPKRKLLEYTPIGIVFSGVKKLAGKSKNLSLKEASLEALILDSQSSDLLGVRMDTIPLRSLDGETKDMSWEAIEETLKVYADRFRKKVEQQAGG